MAFSYTYGITWAFDNQCMPLPLEDQREDGLMIFLNGLDLPHKLQYTWPKKRKSHMDEHFPPLAATVLMDYRVWRIWWCYIRFWCIALKLNQIDWIKTKSNTLFFSSEQKLVTKRYPQGIQLFQEKHITCTKTCKLLIQHTTCFGQHNKCQGK